MIIMNKYDKNSLKAEEFINDGEILDSLKFADENKNNLELVDKIIEKAKSSDVPLYEDNKLANTLSKLDIGEYIPPELYSIVAEILVFVDNLDKIKGKIYDRK